MSNTRLNYLLYLMPLFMTAVLLVIPFQAQAQPTSREDTCFPVEPGAGTLMCTEGPASGDPEANSTSTKKGSSSNTSEDTCFPVEPGAGTLMCTEDPASGDPEANSTS